MTFNPYWNFNQGSQILNAQNINTQNINTQNINTQNINSQNIQNQNCVQNITSQSLTNTPLSVTNLTPSSNVQILQTNKNQQYLPILPHSSHLQPFYNTFNNSLNSIQFSYLPPPVVTATLLDPNHPSYYVLPTVPEIPELENLFANSLNIQHSEVQNVQSGQNGQNTQNGATLKNTNSNNNDSNSNQIQSNSNKTQSNSSNSRKSSENSKNSKTHISEESSSNFITTTTNKYPISLLKTIIQVSEDQFSDEHLKNQPYILRQLLRTQQRWISTKFFASLKHIRRLSRGDWQLVVEALRKSGKFEVNEEGTKVRRLESIPSSLICTVDKQKKVNSILAVNVPRNVSEVDGIQEVFGRFGKIQQMRIVQPNTRLPNYLRGYATQVPELGKVTCAIVEFDSEEAAKRAQMSTNTSSSNTNNMRVALLGPKIKRQLGGNGNVMSSISSPITSSRSSIVSDPDSSLISNVDSGVLSGGKRTLRGGGGRGGLIGVSSSGRLLTNQNSR